ncbi:uncharacterized protein P884DRAFT_254423 [Thermothelomyces heterothallicus CBS 202.75]|uniref:uncharacterized protein n=1 Tax=Thermothelomyces heterothallicus CBS 202.75 TaxID=1149848 RepID=UPI00374337BD
MMLLFGVLSYLVTSSSQSKPAGGGQKGDVWAVVCQQVPTLVAQVSPFQQTRQLRSPPPHWRNRVRQYHPLGIQRLSGLCGEVEGSACTAPARFFLARGPGRALHSTQ